jgi:phosphotransferase system enzyme I (PtsI)
MALKPEKIFWGSGVSPGIVLGQVLKMDSHRRLILKLQVENAEDEVRRFLRAIEVSKEQLEALKSRMEEKVGREHSIILDAHLLILEDRAMNSEILAIIREQNANAEWAVMQATEVLVNAYKSLEDEYFRERHSDIEHVAERIVQNLSGDHRINWGHLPEDLIITSRDFNPSNFATMDFKKVRGLALESGGRTSHTAIVSRGLRLPAVMGIRDFLPDVETGDTVLLDADNGQVIVHPTQGRIDEVRGRIEAFGATMDTSVAQSGWRSETKDGTPISLLANTELPHELTAATASGAEGIGLFRSEFIFFGHPEGFPNMEDQLAVYGMLAREMRPHTVAIRTLDAGSERISRKPDLMNRENPSMGLRGIRLSLNAKETFRTQIEAILRASCEGKIEIVFPMISTVEEVWQGRELIDLVRSKLLQTENLALADIPVGAMIEVPAAVLSLEAIAKEVDFLCVGTNDLIQYVLAVDRGNPNVAYLFQPLHPSVLQCLSRISEVAQKLQKPVRICGEISSNPFFAVLLLGMGFTQLSMTPISIPTVRRVIQELPIDAARQIASKALSFDTAHDVHQYLTQAVSELISWDLTAYANEIAVTSARNGQ